VECGLNGRDFAESSHRVDYGGRRDERSATDVGASSANQLHVPRVVDPVVSPTAAHRGRFDGTSSSTLWYTRLYFTASGSKKL